MSSILQYIKTLNADDLRAIQIAIDDRLTELDANSSITLSGNESLDKYTIPNFASDVHYGFLSDAKGTGYYGTESKASKVRVNLNEDYQEIASKYGFTCIYWIWNNFTN